MVIGNLLTVDSWLSAVDSGQSILSYEEQGELSRISFLIQAAGMRSAFPTWLIQPNAIIRQSNHHSPATRDRLPAAILQTKLYLYIIKNIILHKRAKPIILPPGVGGKSIKNSIYRTIYK